MSEKETNVETAETKTTPKKLLVAIVSKFVETDVDLVPLLGADIAEKVAAFYDSIKTTAVRGLPVAERMAMVETLIKEHYAAMPAVDSPEFGNWSYESMKLLQRKERINREIKEGGAHPEPKGKRGRTAKI